MVKPALQSTNASNALEPQVKCLEREKAFLKMRLDS